MPLSVSRFLDTIERSGLVDKSQLAQSLTELERVSGSEAANDSLIVSDHLGRTGLITPWQSKRLLEGRHAGYFLGKYKLLDHLGTGGMSSVYLAEHPLMRRRVAIKVLPRNRVNDSSYLARFHREARAVASLDHPNIVRAFDVDNDGDVHYLVMEYIEGHDLKTFVDQHGPLPYRQAAEFIRQAAEGLGHAHQAGLIHRDVKPANLLIDGKHVVKLLDMGLARTSDDVDASLTKDHDERMLGTVDYLAPEQALDSHLVDPRADIYSLGCTLYFALTGHPPFPEGTLAQRVLMHQTRDPEPICAQRPDVPPALEAICKRMTAKSTSARYQNAGEVSAALAEWIQRHDAGETTTARAPCPNSADSDEELTLAPLDDEAGGQAGAAKKPPASSASETSRAAKGDTTTVQRRASPQPAERQPAERQPADRQPADRQPADRQPAERQPGSSLKRAVALPPAKQTPGSSIKRAPTGPPAKSGPGSSIKGRPTQPRPAQSPGAGPPQRSGGSSIKGAGGKPAAPRGSPEPAVPDAMNLSTSGGSELFSDPLSEPLLSEPLLSASLLSEPLPGDGLLDSLLSDTAGLSSPQANLLSPPSLAKPAGKKPTARKSRWESPWFLILIGTLLGSLLAALIVLWRSLS